MAYTNSYLKGLILEEDVVGLGSDIERPVTSRLLREVYVPLDILHIFTYAPNCHVPGAGMCLPAVISFLRKGYVRERTVKNTQKQ